MRQSVVTCLLVIFTFHCVSSLYGVDYRVDLLRQRSLKEETGEGPVTVAPVVEICKGPGFACDSECKKVYACMPSAGGYKPKPVLTCKDTETCLNGNCTTALNPQCSGVRDIPFVCNTVGTFPDPFNCKRYHMCPPDEKGVVGKAALVNCVGNYGYNSRTTFCDKKLPTGTCGADFPVPLCTSFGQTAALKENPSLYYMCWPTDTKPDVLYPNLFACENGGLYDSKTYTCK